MQWFWRAASLNWAGSCFPKIHLPSPFGLYSWRSERSPFGNSKDKQKHQFQNKFTFLSDLQSICFFNGPLPSSFSLFLSVQINSFFPDDWIRTSNLWCRKRQLYQMSHNHCLNLYRIVYNWKVSQKEVKYKYHFNFTLTL